MHPEALIKKQHAYMALLMKEMGLSMKFKIKPEFLDDAEEALATATVQDHSQHVDFQFCKDFFKKPKPDRRQCSVHEILHVPFAKLQYAARSVEDSLGAAAYSVFDKWHTNALEETIDILADGWAEKLPLPNF